MWIVIIRIDLINGRLASVVRAVLFNGVIIIPRRPVASRRGRRPVRPERAVTVGDGDPCRVLDARNPSLVLRRSPFYRDPTATARSIARVA